MASTKKINFSSNSINGEMDLVNEKVTEVHLNIKLETKSDKKKSTGKTRSRSTLEDLVHPTLSGKKISLAPCHLNGETNLVSEKISEKRLKSKSEKKEKRSGKLSSSPSSEAPVQPDLSPSTKMRFPLRTLNGDTDSTNEVAFFEERLKSNSDKKRSSRSEPKGSLSIFTKRELSPCDGKERSLDYPSSRLHSTVFSLSDKDGEQGRQRRKKPFADTPTNMVEECTEQQREASIDDKKSLPESKNKFTWCGSCKSSKSGAVATSAKSKRTSSTSPLKKLSRSSLSTDPVDGSKIALNLSKYSPCASRLAASSKILSNDSLGGMSPESPLHASRSRSPVLPSPSINIQQLQRSAPKATTQSIQHSKSVSGPESCVTSPTSEATNLSYSPSGTEILSLEEVFEDHSTPKAVAPASMIELSLKRERQTAIHRSPR